ncbi:MAG: MCP four helix bundle domain-containing protein [Firmicutes bacterium]|nr:MCP four helix bundle domain-containing protein [Bacillota bacterium]
MKNMRIGQILSFSFGILIFLTVVIGILGIFFTVQINSNYVSTVVPGSKALDYLSDMWLYYDDIKYEATNALAARNKEEAQEALADFDSDYEQVLDSYEL